MTDLPPGSSSPTSDNSVPESSDYGDFLVGVLIRIAFMIFYGVLGYVSFILLIIMGVVQVVVALVTREPNKELGNFARSAATYLGECMAYVAFARDEKPFPFGSPFPKSGDE